MPGDLNLKKSWHPGTFKNQEIVWKKEQEKEYEKVKLEQLKKELQEERDREELARLQDQGRNRLEWMYAAGPSQAQDFIDQDKEDYLLGRKKIDSTSFQAGKDEVPSILTKVQSLSQAPVTSSSAYGLFANTTRDFQNKVREDPLLMFKRQEQASLEAVMSNPLKVGRMVDATDDAKKKKREDKAERKESRHVARKEGRERERAERRSGVEESSVRRRRSVSPDTRRRSPRAEYSSRRERVY